MSEDILEETPAEAEESVPVVPVNAEGSLPISELQVLHFTIPNFFLTFTLELLSLDRPMVSVPLIS